MAKKEQKLWLGQHPAKDDEHLRDLDLKAAIYQFHHGMDRSAAEKRVMHEDRVERHQQAAAHHIDGMRAANAVGNHEDAQKHHAMYSLHTKSLGHDPAGPVHPDVAKWQGDKDKKHAYTFKGHGDDQFLTQPVHDAPPGSGAPMAKSEVSTFRVIRGGPVNTAPKYGHLRIVKAEDWTHIIGAWTDLAKADDSNGGRVKQFDINKTWLRHRHMPEEKAFDYSSWLTPEQRDGGYRMFVLSHGNGNPVRAHVTHQGRKAGSASGNVDQGDLEVESYHLAHPQHHGRGLEVAMLNSMMGHAKQHMGADYLSHGPFTPEASGLIEAVAKPHGFELGQPEDIEDDEVPVDQPPARAISGGVKMRSGVENRTPRSFRPRVPQWWATSKD